MKRLILALVGLLSAAEMITWYAGMKDRQPPPVVPSYETIRDLNRRQADALSRGDTAAAERAKKDRQAAWDNWDRTVSSKELEK